MQATALAVAPDWVVGNVLQQLQRLSATQTLPFSQPFADYAAGLQRARELEVGEWGLGVCVVDLWV